MPSTLETKITGLSNKIKQLINTKANKTNGASEITDSNSDDYTHIASNMQSGATQATINDSINIKLGNVVEKSLTNGLLKNDGTVDTNTYLQSGFTLADANKNVVTDSSGGLTVEAKPDLSGYATTSALNGKLDVNQGTSYNDKYLKVVNGNIICEDLFPLQLTFVPKSEDNTGAIAINYLIEDIYTVQIIWEDDNDSESIRPSDVSAFLKTSSTVVQTIILNTSNNWTYTVTAPKYDYNGNSLSYIWQGEAILGYDGPNMVTVGNTTTITYEIMERPQITKS